MTSKRKIKFKFTFHNVGQGLFYSGKVENFNFIYDCGTEKNYRNYMDKEIDRYVKNELGSKKLLDLLILSHFHEDHISGLDRLLNQVNVDTVIIPYLTPVERIVLSLRNINLNNNYYNFLVDPVDYLFKKDVKRIGIIGGKRGGEPNYNENIKTDFSNDENDSNHYRKFFFERLEDDKNLKKNFLTNESEWKKDKRLQNVFIKNHRYSIQIMGVWIFRFYNFKLKEKKINSFINELQKNKIHIGSRASLGRIIKNKKTREKLRDSYKKLSGDLNYTSLVLYHGPIRGYKSCNYQYKFTKLKYVFCRNCYLRMFVPKNYISHFLTGDINLNRGYNDLINHFCNYLDDISLSLVPHHGAQTSWNADILSDLKNCHSYVASSSISNIYGHPRFRVVSDIFNNSYPFCWNNEKNEIRVEGMVNW